jgi:predicted phosphodiesterase
MRIAVLSDIHGNLPALEAVLASLRPYDAIWQLGDVVGYGPQPNEVVALLASEKALGVRGNHDSAAVGELDTDAFNDDARTAIEWTMGELSDTTREWLTSLQRREELEGFTLVHGSPRDPTWEYVYAVSIARANINRFATTHCLVGHTHVPLVYRQAGSRTEPWLPRDGSQLELDERRALLNPGSVGQPRDGDRRASAMLLDTEQMTATWHRVEYPIDVVQQLMDKAGLPKRLVARLSHGL